MGMRFTGLQKAINGCDRFESELPEAAGDGVDDSTEHLMRESQIQVPEKTGKLKGSGRYVSMKVTGLVRSQAVRYGYQTSDSSDESVLDYAAAVHEILKASHAPPTKAKYVEDPLVQGVPSYKRYVIRRVNKRKKKAFR